MSDVVTDPALIAQLEQASNIGSGASLTPNTPKPAAPAGSGAVTDPQLLAELEAGASLHVPADAKAGPNGLMWNASGGYDPNTGELVMAGKPFSENAPSQGLAAAAGFLNGVPVVGPLLQRGAVNAGSWLRNKIYGDPQDQTQDAVSDDIANSEAAYPKTTTAAGIGGAVAGTAPLAETELGARALGLVGGIPMRIAQGAAGGAALSGADAIARGQDPLIGAGVGAGMGFVAPVAGRAIGGVVRGAMDALPVAAPSPFANLSATAQGMLSSALGGETPQTIDAANAIIGPNGFVGDINHPLAQLTKSIADQPDQTGGAVRAAYNARAASDGDRINSAITDALGPQINLTALTQSDQAARKAAADPLYTAWRNTPVQMTPELQRIIQLPSVQKAIPEAQRLAGDESQPFVDNNGNPTAMTWDYVKRAVDDSARSAGPGTNGARVAGNISSQITSAIDNHPDPNVAGVWKAARQAWANPTAIMNARDAGADALSRSTNPDEMGAIHEFISAGTAGVFARGTRLRR